MINNKTNPVEWALLITELDEAKEHLEKLIDALMAAEKIEQEKYAIDLGHIYAHLNRAWYCRDQENSITSEVWEQVSKYPTDLRPIG